MEITKNWTGTREIHSWWILQQHRTLKFWSLLGTCPEVSAARETAAEPWMMRGQEAADAVPRMRQAADAVTWMKAASGWKGFCGRNQVRLNVRVALSVLQVVGFDWCICQTCHGYCFVCPKWFQGTLLVLLSLPFHSHWLHLDHSTSSFWFWSAFDVPLYCQCFLCNRLHFYQETPNLGWLRRQKDNTTLTKMFPGGWKPTELFLW